MVEQADAAPDGAGSSAEATERFDTFISHASEDRPVAARLREALASAGLRTWASFTDIPLGAPYPVWIDKALPASRTLVLLVSRHSLGSEHVFREISQASSAGKPILPIYIEPDVEMPAGLRYYLQSLHRVKVAPDAIESVASLVAASVRDHDVWLGQAVAPTVAQRLSALSPPSWYRAFAAVLIAGLLIWAAQAGWRRHVESSTQRELDAQPDSLALLSVTHATRADAGQPWLLRMNVILADVHTRYKDLGLSLRTRDQETALARAFDTAQVGGGQMLEVELPALDDRIVACLTLPHPRDGRRWRVSTSFKAQEPLRRAGGEQIAFVQEGVPLASRDDGGPCR